MALPYASTFEWNVERIRRVRDLELSGAEFVVRRPAWGNQAVATLISFPSEQELAEIVGNEPAGGVFTVCAGARVLSTCRLPDAEPGANQGWSPLTKPATSLRQRADELLADRVEEVLDDNPKLVTAIVEASLLARFQIPAPPVTDPWDELALEAVRESPALQQQLVVAYLAKHGIDVDQHEVDQLGEFIDQMKKLKEVRELLNPPTSAARSFGFAALEAVGSLMGLLNSGQLAEAVRAFKAMRSDSNSDGSSPMPPETAQQGTGTEAESPASPPDPLLTDDAPESSAEPGHSPPPAEDPPVDDRAPDTAEIAGSIDWVSLLGTLQEGPGAFAERALQSMLDSPDAGLGVLARALQGADHESLPDMVRNASLLVSSDRFRTAVTTAQGPEGFEALVQVNEFLGTQQGMRWLQEATQILIDLDEARPRPDDEGHERTQQQPRTDRQ